MRHYLKFIYFLVLFGCKQTETKKVVEAFDNGKESVVYYYQDPADTLTYRKEVFFESGRHNYIGNIVNNKKEGVWTWWYENGNKKDQCKYSNGKEIDTIYHWYANGKLKQFDIIRQGKVSSDKSCTICCNLTTMRYFENGNPKETFTWVDNIQQDTAKYWFENGRINFIAVFKDGIQNGIFKEYYPNGQIKNEGFFLNDKQHDTSKHWFENGALKEISVWKEGVQNGIFKKYYSNGQIQVDANYVDGWEEGKVIKWDSLGKVTSEQFWKDKKLIKK